jgi:hypothetical protein
LRKLFYRKREGGRKVETNDNRTVKRDEKLIREKGDYEVNVRNGWMMGRMGVMKVRNELL